MIFGAALTISVIGGPALAETVFLKGTAYQGGINNKEILAGSSELLISNSPIKRVAVSNPSVADIRVLSNTSAMIRGKQIGKTTILVWEGDQKAEIGRPSRFDILVKRDISELVSTLKVLDPGIVVDYIIIPATQINDQGSNASFAGPNTLSYKTQPQKVDGPEPSLLINPNTGQQQQQGQQAQQQQQDIEKIILSGKVKSADVMAKALTTTALYIGDQPDFQIRTREGGLIVDKINQLITARGAAGGNGNNVLDEQIQFTANLESNLSNGSIVSTQSGKVVSMLELDSKSQIAVKIRFYEVSRSAGQLFRAQLGATSTGSPLGSLYSTNITSPAGTGVAGVQAGVGPQGAVVQQQAGTAGSIFGLFPVVGLYLALEALERKGEARALAEPTIVVQSGEIGTFRVGGEVPVLNAVAAAGGVANSFDFVPYGISLAVIPTITDKDGVLLNVNAVSRDIDPDPPVAQNTGGTIPPSFLTKRATTQVEMDPTQALMLAGLINNNSNRNLQKFPFLGDIPILGTFFRGKDASKSESELIIVLSPEIIRPTTPIIADKPSAYDVNSPYQANYDAIPTSLPPRNDPAWVEPTKRYPFTAPDISPADLSKPSTVNDLDNIYR